MITISFKEETYTLPTDWSDINIGQLQSLAIVDETTDETDKVVQIISILSGISIEDIYELPCTEYIKLREAIAFISSEIPNKILQDITIDDVTYKFQCSLVELTVREYDVIESLCREQNTDNLHLLMAVFYRPEGEKFNWKLLESRGNLFKEHMPITCAMGAQVFMEVLGQISSSHTQTSLK